MYTSVELAELINSHISESTFLKKEPTALYEPIQYTLNLGGKRIRPMLMLMAYNLYKEDVSSILDPAMAVEMYHSFTLLHDDLMDKATLRRKKQTVHLKWNENTAILSGDAMLILSYQLISRVPEKELKSILDTFTEATLGVGEGQQYDMDFEQRTNVTVAEYLKMTELKTAILLAAALKIGAILGNASTEDATNLYKFGMELGIAFQLQDDLLDVYGNEVTFGKKIGGDIVANKKTYLLINALQQADKEQKIELEQWLKRKSFDPQEKIKAVTNLYNRIGVQQICEKEMNNHFQKALLSLKKVEVKPEQLIVLQQLAHDLMHRNS